MALIPQNSLLQGQISANRDFNNPHPMRLPMKSPSPTNPNLLKKPSRASIHGNAVGQKTTGNRDGFEQMLIADGQQLMRAGKLREAVRAFETVLKTAPDMMSGNSTR
jgi:hypothetical protein